MSYNLPLLASDIEENMEVINGVALKFKNKDVNDLAKKLKQAVDNPAYIKNKAMLAKKSVDKNYNWDNITKETINLYKQPFYSPAIAKLKISKITR
jgi:glycosyltransferase involved in cell wall biosynthesis